MIMRIPFVQLKRSLAACVFAATALATAPVALAGPGHGHAGAAAPQAAGALPRFAATSETFELVGVLNDKHLTLYLDRATDNSPVKDAQVQLELGGNKVDVKPQGEGEFEATLAQPLRPGVIPVTATVIAGAETDLLAGELDLHAAAEPPAHVHSWTEYAGWAIAGVAGLALLLWLAAQLTRARRRGAA